MTSTFAIAFLVIAALCALMTAGEAWTALQTVSGAYQSSNDKIFQTAAMISRWAIDPVFLCGSAVMIEFLEPIWRELVKANAARKSGDGA